MGMNKLWILAVIGFALLGCETKKGSFLVHVQSHNTHEVSIAKLTDLIEEQRLTLFEIIDHTANAKKVKMNLKPETVVVFGNPKMGTILMNCNPSMGVDLPLRILISTDYEGLTTFTYTNPEYWSLKHNIKDSNCLAILNKASMAMADLSNKASLK